MKYIASVQGAVQSRNVALLFHYAILYKNIEWEACCSTIELVAEVVINWRVWKAGRTRRTKRRCCCYASRLFWSWNAGSVIPALYIGSMYKGKVGITKCFLFFAGFFVMWFDLKLVQTCFSSLESGQVLVHYNGASPMFINYSHAMTKNRLNLKHGSQIQQKKFKQSKWISLCYIK